MKFLSCLIFLTLALSGCAQPVQEDVLKGAYLGQKLPGTEPVLFAPGIVSTGMNERDLTVSPAMDEIYFSVRYKTRFAIAVSKIKNGVWTKPEVAPFSGEHNDIEPYIQPDGKKMYFVSKRPVTPGEKNKFEYNMWVMDKTDSDWGKPKPVEEPINGFGSVFYPSITKTGTLYFTRRFEDNSEYIFRSRLVNGKYTEPEKLPDNVNTTKSQFNTFISPDEDFLIIPVWGRKDTKGSSDYFVSFRDKNDNWSDLINLGDKINTKFDEYTPSLSPDGKYFFFQRKVISEDSSKAVKYSDIVKTYNSPENSNSDIYWVDAKVIRDLNPIKK
ncbi:MAG: hypothetical protein ACEPO8_05280 [Rhodothermaceae bacterium]